VPTRRTFDLVLIMLLAWPFAKALGKMEAARHASTDTGLSGQLAKAANIIL
jgi:hypothetical protein